MLEFKRVPQYKTKSLSASLIKKLIKSFRTEINLNYI